MLKRLHSAGLRAAACTLLAAGAALPGAHAGAPGPVVAPRPDTAVHADQLILQFKRPDLRAALREAGREGPARTSVQRALDAMAKRHGVALHYVQTLGVGSALVAVSPAAYPSGALDLLVRRMGADAEVASVEINARMVPFKPAPR
ncbi:hypothetical protein IP87_03110 [beta proteobacterium AAP121]|nr:hypothetical protein IP80_11550 [beta proteobacterium AAP65]KPG00343.1 hypothetical protein IP87_03110 [beta proteobacterium AAP121]